MTRKKKIELELSEKLYKEVVGAAKYIGITKEQYLLFLVLRTQPIPIQIPVQVPVEEPEQFQPDTSMLEDQAQEELDDYVAELATNKKSKLKIKKQDCSYLG